MLAAKPSLRSTCRAASVPRAQPLKAIGKVVKDVEGALAKPVLTAAVVNIIMAAPAQAGAGNLFDFNLTLPIMVGQFLLLMVFLDKTWFTPVGKLLDERDALIREKLSSVKGDSGSTADMQAEAERILKEARAEANAAINEAKRSVQAEQDARIEELKQQLDKDLLLATKDLERERRNAASSVNEQVDALAEEIMSRVLPEGEMPAPAPAGGTMS
jgi:F-type H+-transporting ATPase subunit b